MEHLTFDDLITIKSALLVFADHKKELAEIMKDGPTYKRMVLDREESLRLNVFFENVLDRLLDSENFSVRISVKMH